MNSFADLQVRLRHLSTNITIEFDGSLRWDTGDTDPKDQWVSLCDLQSKLRKLGYELHDSDSDHDTIWGTVRAIPQPVEVAQPRRGTIRFVDRILGMSVGPTPATGVAFTTGDIKYVTPATNLFPLYDGGNDEVIPFDILNSGRMAA